MNAASGANVGTASNNEILSENHINSDSQILTLTFNQDATSLAMGTAKSYSLFTISQEDKLDDIHDCEIHPFKDIHYFHEDVCIIERLFSSSLIAIVSKQAPRKLKVCHFKKSTEICSYSYSNTILSVKLNRSRLVVCLEDSVYIHNMRDMKILHTLRDVSQNHDGLCALSSNETNPFLALPGSSITGEIQLFDTTNLNPGIIISAHESPLVAMAFDMTGAMIATASNKGTVIRIHDVTNGSRLFEFRRGVRRVATIYSFAFSPDSTFLAASSNTGTIHIFRLVTQKEKPAEESSSWMSSFSRILGDVAYYLPKQTSEVLTQDRAFATVHLQLSGMKTIIAMNILNKTLKLFAAGYDGIVRVYEVNTNDGGECKQISQYLLFNMCQNTENQQDVKTNNRRTQIDGSSRIYPPNLLKNENSNVPLSSTPNSEKHKNDQLFNIESNGQNFPQLPSPP